MHFSRSLTIKGSLRAVSRSIVLVGVVCAGLAQAATTNFTVAGATTWTVPAGVTSISVVATRGGGGGGGYFAVGGRVVL
jgi:hypothetical protein